MTDRRGDRAIRDIAERKRAEQKLFGLPESVPDAMVVVDGKGTISIIGLSPLETDEDVFVSSAIQVAELLSRTSDGPGEQRQP